MCRRDGVRRQIGLKSENVIDKFLFLKREEEAWIYKTMLAVFEVLFHFQEIALKGEVQRKMNFTYVLGFVVLMDMVKVFPLSSPSFARKTTQKNRARSYSGARRGLMTKWDLELVTWPLLPVLAWSWPDVAIDRVESCTSVSYCNLRKRWTFPVIYGSKWDPLT